MLKLVLISLLSTATWASEPVVNKAPLFPAKLADKTVANRPLVPELLEPAYMAQLAGGGGVTLKWKEMPAITNYHLQVATDPNFKWLVVNEPLITATTYDVKSLEPGKHYYWRVAAQKSSNDAGYTKGAFTKSMFETK